MRNQVDPIFNNFITSIGGEEREAIVLKGIYSPELNLIAASPSISTPPADLPNQHKFTGAWFLEEPDYEVPPALQEFLDHGSPPIIITFGSVAGSRNVGDHKHSRRSGTTCRSTRNHSSRLGKSWNG